MRRGLPAVLLYLMLSVDKEGVCFTLENRQRLIRVKPELKAFRKGVDAMFKETGGKVVELCRRIDKLFDSLWKINGVLNSITVAYASFSTRHKKTTTEPFEHMLIKTKDGERAFSRSQIDCQKGQTGKESVEEA